MKKYNILFLEDKSYYDSLIELDSDKYNCTFNGMSLYKSSDKTILFYDLVINFTFNSDLINFIINRAKNLNVKTLLLADGIFEWSNAFQNPIFKKKNIKLFHPVINDYFICVGSVESRYFNFNGISASKYLPLRMKPNFKEKIKKSNSKCFLITAANTPFYNETEKLILIDILKRIIKEIELLGYRCMFRIFDSVLIKELTINKNSNIKSGTFEQCLRKVDYVITTPSSISITAMFHEKPTATILYRDTPITFSSGWNITSLSVISETLNNMILSDSDRMNFQNFQVKNYLDDSELELSDFIKNSSIDRRVGLDNNFEYNLLMSKFNFNFEFMFRKIYLFYKKLFK